MRRPVRQSSLRARVMLLRALLLVSGGVVVLAVACGGNAEEPFLFEPGGPDAATTATATTTSPTSTATGTSPAADSGPEDSGPVCPTVNDLLVTYGLASTCPPCIDAACASEVAACNASCSCPAAIVGFVQCVSLGANPSTCAAVASSETSATTVLGFFMCASSCKDQCHLAAPDAGADGGDAAASDAAASDASGVGDGGASDADASGDGG